MDSERERKMGEERQILPLAAHPTCPAQTPVSVKYSLLSQETVYACSPSANAGPQSHQPIQKNTVKHHKLTLVLRQWSDAPFGRIYI